MPTETWAPQPVSSSPPQRSHSSAADAVDADDQLLIVSLGLIIHQLGRSATVESAAAPLAGRRDQETGRMLQLVLE